MIQQVLARLGHTRALFREDFAKRGRPTQHAEVATLARKHEIGAFGANLGIGGKRQGNRGIDFAAVEFAG